MRVRIHAQQMPPGQQVWIGGTEAAQAFGEHCLGLCRRRACVVFGGDAIARTGRARQAPRAVRVMAGVHWVRITHALLLQPLGNVKGCVALRCAGLAHNCPVVVAHVPDTTGRHDEQGRRMPRGGARQGEGERKQSRTVPRT